MALVPDGARMQEGRLGLEFRVSGLGFRETRTGARPVTVPCAAPVQDPALGPNGSLMSKP